MEPLIALVGVTVVVVILNKAWFRHPRGVETALRAGVAAMFTLTGIVHFVGMRAELIAMVPKWLPMPGLTVTVTGILELAAAMAMLHRRLATFAAAGLTLLLIVMFPANVALALSGAPLPWWDELVPRTIMQVLFLTATVTVLVLALRPAGHTSKSDRTPGRSAGVKGATGDGASPRGVLAMTPDNVLPRLARPNSTACVGQSDLVTHAPGSAAPLAKAMVTGTGLPSELAVGHFVGADQEARRDHALRLHRGQAPEPCHSHRTRAWPLHPAPVCSTHSRVRPS